MFSVKLESRTMSSHINSVNVTKLFLLNFVIFIFSDFFNFHILPFFTFFYFVKGLEIKLKINEGAFEILDELLLMTESEQLFPIVSLLRLLLVFGSVRDRYSSDFMIIHQILYKIGIPFEEALDDEEPEEKGDGVQNDEEMENMNLMDIHLLQFTAISAVSHLYHGQGVFVDIDSNLINLGINALRVRNANVRLSAARLLFNLLCEMKRQYVLKEDEREKLVAEMKRICGTALKYSRTEEHVPTVYRLLCIIGMGCYFDDGQVAKAMGLSAETMKEWKGVHAECEEITALIGDLKSLMI